MYEAEIARASAAWGIPASWIQAVIQTESSWNAHALNASDPGGARGLMQITAPTAQAYGITDLESLFDPSVNIDLGTHILADWRKRVGDDAAAIYSGYNSGNPNLYLTSSQVAANVNRFLGNLEAYLAQEPLIATSGAAGALLIAVLVWYWVKRKKRK